jgi:hypothetical protein
MGWFKCPECGELSHSDRKASYFWCSCGLPLTGAHAIPGMAHSIADGTPPPPAAPEPEPQPEMTVEKAEDEPSPEETTPAGSSAA